VLLLDKYGFKENISINILKFFTIHNFFISYIWFLNNIIIINYNNKFFCLSKNIRRSNHMKKAAILFMLFLFAAAASMLITGTVVGEEEKTVKKKESESCITSKCHSAMATEKFVHGPVAAGECSICHGKSPKHIEKPKKNKFKKIENINKLCYSCHDQFEPKRFIHNPVEEDVCTSCHHPHGSENKFQLKAKGGDLCFSCHDKKILDGEYVHGPAAVGGCIACHEPHTADFEKNLRAEGPVLCFMCHTDKAEAFQSASVIHNPVSENCIYCHNPHSEKKQFMLSSVSPGLCYDCHEDKREWIEDVSVKHGAVETDRTCLNCHDAHVSNIAKNLILPPMDLCMSCHDREYGREGGRKVANIKKILEENSDHHGPIQQKDCSGCHDPHGSNSFRILRNPYPPSFYAPFHIANYNLCFGCHEKTIVLNPETTKLTNFRNGEENLHFKHVNKPEKGRTCRACHETHASNFPKHIRESVPFGAWELPVNFEKSETGGSCTPGCHKMKQYDRARRVENP
jgi:predicted CXXCH cytochrome family protein